MLNRRIFKNPLQVPLYVVTMETVAYSSGRFYYPCSWKCYCQSYCYQFRWIIFQSVNISINTEGPKHAYTHFNVEKRICTKGVMLYTRLCTSLHILRTALSSLCTLMAWFSLDWNKWAEMTTVEVRTDGPRDTIVRRVIFWSHDEESDTQNCINIFFMLETPG